MSSSKPAKRHTYDEAVKTETLRLTRAGCSTRAVARRLGRSEKLLYRWQPAPVVAASVTQAQDPAYCALRAESQRLERAGHFKKVLVNACLCHRLGHETR